MLVGRERTEVESARIVRIERPHDGLANGALIGFGVGAALGFSAMWAEQDHRQCDPLVWFDCADPPAGGYPAVTLLTAGLGTAVGVGIDALVRRDPEIYRRGAGAPRVTLSPAFGPGLRSAVVSVSW